MSERDNSPSPDRASDEYRYAKLALAWHGWGSPVGLGIFLVCVAVVVAVVRYAFVGA